MAEVLRLFSKRNQPLVAAIFWDFHVDPVNTNEDEETSSDAACSWSDLQYLLIGTLQTPITEKILSENHASSQVDFSSGSTLGRFLHFLHGRS
ncbi:hypothetical protein RRG08_041335 [Elysia crispata]|uniref:Uncharacterized protein n=1 Tax=Elysia crispata TaxID=231223 RepID=A0AAE1DSY1_9GAST|nr:hypothetical protein RRG08_041335 [Elysia crispata]